MKNDLLRTVAYFTSIGQSVSANDVWQWLYDPTRSWSLREVIDGLKDARDSLFERDGRFVLRGHEQVFEIEHDMYLDADRKYQKAHRYTRWLKLVPGIRAVAICNTLAWESTTSSSDTDFLVIARPGTLWLARFLAVVPLIIFRMRPGERKIDPVDFTFFISDRALDISSLALKGGDPYLAYWTASLVPILDDGVMKDFRDANAWVKEILPNASHRWLASFRRPRSGSSSSTSVYPRLESIAKRLSVKRFPSTITEQMNRSSNVIVNDDMLKFHVHDDRQQIRDKWQNLYEQYT